MFDVFLITKTPFYTFIIDRITKPNEFDVKQMSTETFSLGRTEL